MSKEEDFKTTDLEHEADWYFALKSGKNEGPYVGTEIRAFYENQKINESTYIWSSLWDHSDWIPIKLIKHLYPKIFLSKSEDKNKIKEQDQIPVLAGVNKDAVAVLPIVEKEILNEVKEKVVVTSTRAEEIIGYKGLSTMTNNNLAATYSDPVCGAPDIKVTENLEFESTPKPADMGAVEAVGSLEVSGLQYLKSTEKDLQTTEQPKLDAAVSAEKLDSVMDQLKAFEFEMEQYNNALKNMDMVLSATSLSAISGKEQSPIIDEYNKSDSVGLEGLDLPKQEDANDLAPLGTWKEARVLKKECSSKIAVFSEESNLSVYQPKTESHIIPSASCERQTHRKESPQEQLIEDLSSEVRKSAAESSLSGSFNIFLSGDQLHKVDNITPMHSILKLREIAAQRENVPVNLVVLLYRNIVLDNDMSLKDYNIERGGTIVLKFNEPVINNDEGLKNEPSKLPRDEAPPPYSPCFDEFDPGITIDGEPNKSENLKAWKSKPPVSQPKPEKPLTPRRKVSPSSFSLSGVPVIHKPLPALSGSISEMYSKPLPPCSSSYGTTDLAFSEQKSLSEVISEEDLALEAYPERHRESIRTLEGMGFPRDSVVVALEITSFSKKHAASWLLSKEYEQHKKLDKRLVEKTMEESKERGVQPIAKAKKRLRDWNCPACTFLNSSGAQCCAMCGNSKDGNRQEPVPLELDYRKPQDDELIEPIENLNNALDKVPISLEKKREKKIYGNYKVRILKASGIDQKASYCLLSLGKTTKRTKTLKKAKVLYLNDVFHFTGVKADSSLQLRISLMAKKLRADKVVGQVSYAMPTIFNRCCEDFLELINEQNKPSGNVTISVLFTQSPTA